MSRTRVKVCGFTRLEDVSNAVHLGVDALGFVFVESSPRFVKIDQVKGLIRHLPPFVQTVGLFMNQSEQEIREVLREISLNLLQFHGDETPEFCEQFKVPYIKAIPMGDKKGDKKACIEGNADAGGANTHFSPVEYAAQYTECVGFLLDSHALGESGGSGGVFDWEKIPEGFNRPLILAGGLNIDNVCEAVQQVKPFAVDVSSGVESSKGIKNKEKMAAFVSGVINGDKRIRHSEKE